MLVELASGDLRWWQHQEKGAHDMSPHMVTEITVDVLHDFIVLRVYEEQVLKRPKASLFQRVTTTHTHTPPP